MTDGTVDVVFVHGIAQEQSEAIPLEEEWANHLAGGVQRAGFDKIAERMWHSRHQPNGIRCRMAFYGDCFLPEGAMGTQGTLNLDGMAADEIQLASDLTRAWIGHAAVRATSGTEMRAAQQQLAALDAPEEDAQGVGQTAAGAIRRLAVVPWFAKLGFGAAQIFNSSARQVTAYFTNLDVRETAIGRVAGLVDRRTRVIIGHSLGSVVAYEAIHRLDQPLPLFITIGSPLGIRSIVTERLIPKPSFPPHVQRWINVADTDDFIAAEPNLADLFHDAKPLDAELTDYHTVDNGAEPHTANFYLTKAQIGRPVGQALSG